MHLRYINILLLLLLLPFFAGAVPYKKNPYVPDFIWYALEPYFVPEDIYEKAVLDDIFSRHRALKSLKALSESGFLIITDPDDKIIVVKHPYLKGYLLKIYLDTQEMPEWDCWLRRARGSRVIQAALDQNGYKHLFKVPKKWIYPLPAEPSPTKKGIYRKNFVLLVEEMDILDHKKNRKAFKKQMTFETLNALYMLLNKYLLIDSVYADNIPYCKDGKIAFVDTEYTGDTTRPVPLSAVGQYLSPEMLSYWEQLIVNGL